MWRWACLFIVDISQSPSGWWQPACRSAWLWLHARRHLVLHMVVSKIRMSCKMTPPHVWFVGWLDADRHHTTHMSINMTESGILTLTENISRGSDFFEKFHNTKIKVFAQYRVCPSCFDPVVLSSRPAWLPSCFRLMISLLRKRPSDQSKTSSNCGRENYLTHLSLTINSSTTSFFEISRSIFIACDFTTKLMFDQSSVSTKRLCHGQDLACWCRTSSFFSSHQPINEVHNQERISEARPLICRCRSTEMSRCRSTGLGENRSIKTDGNR